MSALSFSTKPIRPQRTVGRDKESSTGEHETGGVGKKRFRIIYKKPFGQKRHGDQRNRKMEKNKMVAADKAEPCVREVMRNGENGSMRVKKDDLHT